MEQRWPPGWYPDPGRPGTTRYWDGTAWWPAPGWYEVAGEPGTWRRWTGSTWDGVRRRAPRRIRRAIWALDALAAVLAIGGLLVIATSPLGGSSRAEMDAFCASSDPLSFLPDAIWALWLALVLVALALLVVWVGAARGDALALSSAVSWMGVAALTFPLWLVIGSGLDCGL